MLSFGDFKKNEIANLIGNKDPLGLYSDINKSNDSSDTAIENNNAIKSIKIKSKDEVIPLDTEMKTKIVHDVIPHYIRTGNCNNSTNTNKDEDSTPTLHVNSKSRPTRSVSSGNLAKKTSFKASKVYNILARDLALTLVRARVMRSMMAIQAFPKTLILHQIAMN